MIDRIIQYSEDVLSGKIVAGVKHKWACQRFLSDLERSKSNDFEYEFIPEEAEKFFRWMRLFKHRKGVLAGQHKEPELIELFVFGNVYGWYHKESGYRRFSKMYWQVARKNAKTQDLAIMGTYELFVFLPDEVAEVYCAATKKEQAELVYDEAVAMLQDCEAIQESEHYKVAYKKITRLKNGAFMKALSKDDRKTGDGTNPQCFIVDEYHAHETTEIYEIGDSGIGARPQPIVPIITTAGFELNNPCYRIEYQLCSRILDPEDPTELDTYFVMINELDRNMGSDTVEVNGRSIPPGEIIDDINDPVVWEKANPIVCSYPEGRKMLRDAITEAQASPEKMRGVLTKRLNIWVNSRENGYMDMEKFKRCLYPEEKILEMVKEDTDMQAYVGVDLSARIDLTSVTFELKGENGEYYVLSRSFMPRERYLTRMNEDRVPYDMWVNMGHLILTDGAVVDYRYVKDHIIDYAERNGLKIREICLDPYAATQISSDLIDEGYEVVDIRQGAKTLSEPTKSFREEIYKRNVYVMNSPLYTWTMGNCIVTMSHNESILLDKKKSKQRIDPVASTINAHTRCMVSKKKRRSPGVMFI